MSQLKTITFYSPRDAHGYLSNFSLFGFHAFGYYWETVEHYYQAQKHAGSMHYHRIRAAKTPKEAALLGRGNPNTFRFDWDAIRDTVMTTALTHKFSVHRILAQQLIGTGDAILIEASPKDSYWGWGFDKQGQNKLGKILMNVRLVLQHLEKTGGDGSVPSAIPYLEERIGYSGKSQLRFNV